MARSNTHLSPLERLLLSRYYPSVLSSFTLLALLLAALVGLSRLPLFQLSQVVIQGDLEHTELEQVQHSTAHFLQAQNFWSLRLHEAQALFLKEPWVRKAVVARVFPNTLRVELEEHQATAIWHSSQGQRYINADGEIFEASTSSKHEHLPLFKGEDEQAQRIMNTYIALSQALQQKQTEIKEIELSPGGLWRIRLSSDLPIELGRGTEYELLARLEQFFYGISQIYPQKSPREALQMIVSADLRYQRGFSIRKRVAAERIGVE